MFLITNAITLLFAQCYIPSPRVRAYGPCGWRQGDICMCTNKKLFTPPLPSVLYCTAPVLRLRVNRPRTVRYGMVQLCNSLHCN